MKLIICFLFLLNPFNYSQVDEISITCKKLFSKIEIGSTTEEVRKILGKPTSVIPGFPEKENCSLILKLPDNSGQLNYTCWIYHFTTERITHTEEKKIYFINSKEVSETRYLNYAKLDTLYLDKTTEEIIHPNLKEERLEPIDEYIVSRDVELVPSNQFFDPIFYVIFEKGTGVVADIRTFFLMFD